MAELALTAAMFSVQVVLPAIKLLVNLKKDEEEEVQSFEGHLKVMKWFLENEESRSPEVEEIREIAFDIEDALDMYVFHARHKKLHNKEITRNTYQFAHEVKHWFPLVEISNNITSINKRIKNIVSRNQMLGADGFFTSRPASSPSTSSPQVQVTPLLPDDELVGYKNLKEDFISQLTDSENGLIRIAVVGPPGSGKTALVKNVFWSRKLQGQFDCHAWVHVSQDFNVEQLLINMLDQFQTSKGPWASYPHTQREDTQIKLRNFLEKKRYIVVLDDVWRSGHLDSILNALPDNSLRSRIVVTTTASEVASFCASPNGYKHYLKGLEWLDAWTLFCKKAFADNNGQCPEDLKDYSRRIVKICEGLPLAILAVGGVLSRKPKYPDVWYRFYESLGCGSNSHLSDVGHMLLSSYKDLSSNLKQCFLYFSVFPEDYSVSCGRLMRLWVAEGFARETDYKTAEEVARDHLNELIQRNLVDVSRWNLDGHRPRNCRVLSIVHKFIVDKCKDENFVSIFSGEIGIRDKRLRRLSVQMDSTCSPEDIQRACTHWMQHRDYARVRSTLLFNCDGKLLSVIENSFKDFQLLKVLDFQGSPLRAFPKQILDLTIMTYLSLRNTEIRKIPKSIKKLCYLETLDLKQTNVIRLPKEIWQLKELRYLFGYKYNVVKFVEFDSAQGVTIFEGIGKSTKLQKLHLVKAGKDGSIIRELKHLSQLRKLGLTGLKRGVGRDLCASIENMKKLETLDLCTIDKEEYLELGGLVNPPPFLQWLYLKGCMERLPGWISSLDNLFKVGLMYSKLQHSPLNTLQNLPHLYELLLVDCYVGEKLVFQASSFKKLKNLVIELLSQLHTVVVEEGALPELQQLSLRRCRNLKMPPLGIHNLGKVEELTLYDMNQELISPLRKGGEYTEMVEHIPVVHSFTLNGGSWSFENLSFSSY